MCAPDYREAHFFFPLLILSVFCDLIGCPFYFSSHLSGQWRRDRLSLNMQNAGKGQISITPEYAMEYIKYQNHPSF